MAISDQDLIGAKIAASEARTDTKLAELLGETRAKRPDLLGRVRVLPGRVELVETTTSGLKATVIVTGMSVVALIVVALAWGDALFDRGLNAADPAEKAAGSAVERAADEWQRTTDRQRSWCPLVALHPTPGLTPLSGRP